MKFFGGNNNKEEKKKEKGNDEVKAGPIDDVERGVRGPQQITDTFTAEEAKKFQEIKASIPTQPNVSGSNHYEVISAEQNQVMQNIADMKNEAYNPVANATSNQGNTQAYSIGNAALNAYQHNQTFTNQGNERKQAHEATNRIKSNLSGLADTIQDFSGNNPSQIEQRAIDYLKNIEPDLKIANRFVDKQPSMQGSNIAKQHLNNKSTFESMIPAIQKIATPKGTLAKIASAVSKLFGSKQEAKVENTNTNKNKK